MEELDPRQAERVFGRDLALNFRSTAGFFEDADLVSTDARGQGRRLRDIDVTVGQDNLIQAIVNRLKTRRGELRGIGHPDYGSRHHELIGEPNVQRTRNLIKLYVLQALAREPRIEKVVSADVRPEHDPPREVVRVELSLQVARQTAPLNLVIPFDLGGAP